MIKNSARRFTLAVTFGLSTLAAVNVARAQSTATGGVTGTDPEPKSCGCVTGSAATTTTKVPTSSTTSTSGTVAQALLVFLGAA